MSKDEDAEKFVSAAVEYLTAERETQGMSKNGLAKLAGIDPKTVSFIENGERNPTLFTLVKIARALDVSLADILQKVEERDSQ